MFISLEKSSGRNNVASDKVNFTPDIRQNFFKNKNQDINMKLK